MCHAHCETLFLNVEKHAQYTGLGFCLFNLLKQIGFIIVNALEVKGLEKRCSALWSLTKGVRMPMQPVFEKLTKTNRPCKAHASYEDLGKHMGVKTQHSLLAFRQVKARLYSGNMSGCRVCLVFTVIRHLYSGTKFIHA